MTDSRNPFELWAKTGSNEGEWHSLPCHLLDVAACAEVLWDSLPNGLRESLSEQLGISSFDTRSLVCFLAASHDIGKANPYFQAKAEEHRPRLRHWGLRCAREPVGHGQGTTALLNHWLRQRWSWEPRISFPIASAVGGHHGVFEACRKLSRLEVDGDPWLSTALLTLDRLSETLGTQCLPIKPEGVGPFVGWLAGFVTVADWLGSHDEMVVYQSSPCDLALYWYEARHRARCLAERIGFKPLTPADRQPIEAFLPSGVAPNAIQRLAQSAAEQPFRFVIIEAPTGEGKTEAALAFVEAGRAEGRGLYFALPTMATANGLIGRIERYLQLHGGQDTPQARLLHSHAWLFDRQVTIRPNPGDAVGPGEGEDWFAGLKRGMLDRYGVGTIDQMLIGALNVKHFFVRLFALAGKTVVVDEVHAYDVYMSHLLYVLLAWLRVLDCRVVLLSATLPSQKRNELLSSWGISDCGYAPYPRVTIVQEGDRVEVTHCSSRTRKPLTLVPMAAHPDDALSIACEHLLRELRSGARTAVFVVNTVNRAQSALELVRNNPLATGIEVMLFHARFTAEDRERIESEVLRKFGKTANREAAGLLIATQVVEQSLDLDFDAMVSDLAPVDLLLQRAGRLHRHARGRDGSLQAPDEPDQRPEPVLHVLVETGDELSKDLVYSAAILRQTLVWLGNGRRITQPQDIEEAIEEVYSCLPAVATDSELDEQMARAIERLQGFKASSEEAAKLAAISRPDAECPVSVSINRLVDVEGDERHGLAAKTRLETLPSATLVIWPLSEDLPTGPLTLETKKQLVMKSVRVTAHAGVIQELLDLPIGPDWARVSALAHARLARTDHEGRFETSSYRFRYSSDTGLSWESKNA